MSSKNLRELRKEIDVVDQQLLQAISKRAHLAKEIGIHKQKESSSVYRPDREKEVYNNLHFFLQSHPESQLTLSSLKDIYREIMSSSIALEGNLTIAYLGPMASFSHTALMEKFGSRVQGIAQESITDIFRVVQANKEARYGLVPIDNSIEGSIGITLDSLLEFDLDIYAEYYLSVSHQLLHHQEIKTNDIRRLYTFHIAQEQCRDWVRSNLTNKDIELVLASSTAAAAKMAAEKKDGAAIASKLAAQRYGLKIIAKDIQDNPNNTTRFFLVGKEQCLPTHDDKTSIVFSLPDKPGSLFKVLSLFEKEGVNLTKIESRSRRRSSWEYNFFVDFLGNQKSKNISEILKGVQKNSSFFRVLGSYPRIKLLK